MTESVQAVELAKPLSQVERVAYTFISPSRTFTDVIRNQSWLLAFLLTVFASYCFSVTVVQKVGVDQVVQNMMRANPQLQQRLAQSTPEQRSQYQTIAKNTLRYSMAAEPLLVIVFNLVIGGVLLASFNVAFDAKLTFARVFCVLLYADLINTVKPILTTILLWSGYPPASFNLQNPIATNLAYVVHGGSAALSSLLYSLDAVDLWYLIVMAIGFAVIGKLRFAQAASVIFGWWSVIVFTRLAFAAMGS